MKAIKERRSIRIFTKDNVQDEAIEKILEAAIASPSGHNKQPWRFVVLRNEKKDSLIEILINVMKELNQNGVKTGTLKRTAGCIRRSDVIILVFNAFPGGKDGEETAIDYEWIANIQSIGACMQNMQLAAMELGLGTLWVCDVLYAKKEINILLDRNDELVGGICIGYPNEEPDARPRTPWQEVTQWFK